MPISQSHFPGTILYRLTIMYVFSGTLGERLDGISSEGAAQKLRGKVGTSVTVKVHRVKLHLIKRNAHNV